jgi:hypothetical protein
MISYDHNNKKINFSIDTLDDIIKAKNKGKSIIESCMNNSQLDSAKKFVERYRDSTEDLIGASELEIDILCKRKEVGDSVFGKRQWNRLIKEIKDV